MSIDNLPKAQSIAVDPYSLNAGSAVTYPIKSQNYLVDELVNASVGSSTIFASSFLNEPTSLNITAISNGSPTTLTFEISYDGASWFQAYTLDNNPCVIGLLNATDTTNPVAGGTVSMSIIPANYYRVKNSTATFLIVRHQARYSR